MRYLTKHSDDYGLDGVEDYAETAFFLRDRAEMLDGLADDWSLDEDDELDFEAVN